MSSVMQHCRHAIAGPSDAGPLSRTSQFLAAQGAAYVALGLLFTTAPRVGAALFLLSESETLNIDLFRPIGVAVIVVGYFYTMNARANTAYWLVLPFWVGSHLCPLFCLQSRSLLARRGIYAWLWPFWTLFWLFLPVFFCAQMKTRWRKLTDVLIAPDLCS